MPLGPLADLLVGEGQSRLGQEDRLDRAPLLGVRHPLGRSCEDPHGYRPGGDNISEPLAVDRPGCGRDLPLRDRHGHRGGPCPEDPGTRVRLDQGLPL